MDEQDYEIEAWKKEPNKEEGFYWIAVCKNALDAVRIADSYSSTFKTDVNIKVFDHPKDRLVYSTTWSEHGSYSEKAERIEKRGKQ